MKYPKSLHAGNTIGVCAPSSGLMNNDLLIKRLDQAIKNVEALGYKVVESPSVRWGKKCVSANAQTRATEFMDLYTDPLINAIIPPWGGEFLMDMLPHLDLERLSKSSPTWLCGYSDISLLSFLLTTHIDVATIHGSALLNMGYASIHESDLRAFEAMSHTEIVQTSAPCWGTYTGWTDLTQEAYNLNTISTWKTLNSRSDCQFSGRMIGGCLDVLRTIMGTGFAEISPFIKKYKDDGYVWALESCEMNSADLYRVLWQMKEANWFMDCKGVIFGRPDGYSEIQDFALEDSLEQGLGSLDIPVLYNADVGHIPPQMQIVNGALGQVTFKNNTATVVQKCIP